jgi:hypothetical protein
MATWNCVISELSSHRYSNYVYRRTWVPSHAPITFNTEKIQLKPTTNILLSLKIFLIWHFHENDDSWQQRLLLTDLTTSRISPLRATNACAILTSHRTIMILLYWTDIFIHTIPSHIHYKVKNKGISYKHVKLEISARNVHDFCFRLVVANSHDIHFRPVTSIHQ